MRGAKSLPVVQAASPALHGAQPVESFLDGRERAKSILASLVKEPGEHFGVDGTLIQAWTGRKSFVQKDGGDDDGANFKGRNFKGRSRSNETHESKTDPDAWLYCKGNTASELRFMGHTLSDKRDGLIANAMVLPTLTVVPSAQPPRR